jgi:hypothetical protein
MRVVFGILAAASLLAAAPTHAGLLHLASRDPDNTLFVFSTALHVALATVFGTLCYLAWAPAERKKSSYALLVVSSIVLAAMASGEVDRTRSVARFKAFQDSGERDRIERLTRLGRPDSVRVYSNPPKAYR